MKIKKGIDNHWYAVFLDEYDATARIPILIFSKILRRDLHCFGAYCNAWRIL